MFQAEGDEYPQWTRVQRDLLPEVEKVLFFFTVIVDDNINIKNVKKTKFIGKQTLVNICKYVKQFGIN